MGSWLYSAAWVTNVLGIEFHPLIDNTIRAFTLIDVDQGITLVLAIHPGLMVESVVDHFM